MEQLNSQPPAVKTQTQTQESRLRRENGTTTATPAASTHRRGLPQQQQQKKQDEEKRPRSEGSTTTTASSSSSSGGGTPAAANASIARRQSLMRPSPLKTVSSRPTISTGAGAGTDTGTVANATPTKSATTTSQKKPVTRQPPSPKKTDMPPPPLPRHGRSTSLRQPSSTSLASPGGSSVATPGRPHTRHRSQASGDNKTAAKKIEALSTPTVRSKTSFTQQSPKKTVKGLTTGTTPAEDPSLMPSFWPEIAALQTQVLQLHLFHSSSLRQYADWQTESEAQLQKKYDSVAQKYRGIVNEVKQRQCRLNGQALSLWHRNVQEHNRHLGFAEQIQLLSQVIQEVTDLTDEVSGRYTLVLQGFTDWFQKAEMIRKCRSQLDSAAADDLVVFIDPLDRAWRDELDALLTKLEFCSRQLQSLDISVLGYGGAEAHGLGEKEAGESAVFRIARGLEEMLGLMLEEVALTRRIEREIVRSERSWVSRLAEQLTGAEARPTRSARPRGDRVGMWRSALQT